MNKKTPKLNQIRKNFHVISEVMFSKREIKNTHIIDFYTKFCKTKLQLVFWESQPWQIQILNNDTEFAIQKESLLLFQKSEVADQCQKVAFNPAQQYLEKGGF